MSQQEKVETADVLLSPEEREKFQELADEVNDTVENIEMFLEPGDRFAIHPLTFALAQSFDEDESRMKQILLEFVFDAFHFKRGSLESFRQLGHEQWFKTPNLELVLGTDGTDWWLEFVSSVPEEGVAVKAIAVQVSAKVKRTTGKKSRSPKRKK